MAEAIAEFLQEEIWRGRYRYALPHNQAESDIGATLARVAVALAAAETRERQFWQQRFQRILKGFRFLPGGRILAGAGTTRDITLFNCFVMPAGYSLETVFDALREGAMTLQRDGGVGYDFSTLPPRNGCENDEHPSPGPVAYLQLWDAMCATVMDMRLRRGAMMATLRCDHPDVLAFIDAKHGKNTLSHFNLSVQITDEFMHALAADESWPLVFPVAAGGNQDDTVLRCWSGEEVPMPCRVYGRISARELWHRLLAAAWASGDPGLLFVDRINRENNLYYRERITATNPCGEIPLPSYGACDLGSINLPTFVRLPFSDCVRFDRSALRQAVSTAVRMLDNAIDVSRYPVPAQAEQAYGTRRIGLGITGLADALMMLGLHYGEARARQWAADTMREIANTAYRTSVGLAREKAPFPFLKREAYLESAFVRRLPEDIRDGIRKHGIRNSHLLAIAPAGSISLLAGNVSSGIEPVFAWHQRRRITRAPGQVVTRELEDYAHRCWRLQGGDPERLPAHFVAAMDLAPEAHLLMQAALQPFVDNAIAKTLHIKPEATLEVLENLCFEADRLGLKGLTLYRQGCRMEDVLNSTC